jgi:hypothetical protein
MNAIYERPRRISCGRGPKLGGERNGYFRSIPTVNTRFTASRSIASQIPNGPVSYDRTRLGTIPIARSNPSQRRRATAKTLPARSRVEMFASVGLGWLPIHTQTQRQEAATRTPLDSGPRRITADSQKRALESRKWLPQSSRSRWAAAQRAASARFETFERPDRMLRSGRSRLAVGTNRRYRFRKRINND